MERAQHLVSLSPAILAQYGALPFEEGLVAVWNAILASAGELPINSPDRTENIRPYDYALPKEQTKALLEAWMSSASVMDRPGIAMTWCNVGPSSSEEG